MRQGRRFQSLFQQSECLVAVDRTAAKDLTFRVFETISEIPVDLRTIDNFPRCEIRVDERCDIAKVEESLGRSLEPFRVIPKLVHEFPELADFDPFLRLLHRADKIGAGIKK